MTRACMRKLLKDTDDVLADPPQMATRGQCIYSQNNVSGTAVDTVRCGVQKSVTISENVSVFFFLSNYIIRITICVKMLMRLLLILSVHILCVFKCLKA